MEPFTHNFSLGFWPGYAVQFYLRNWLQKRWRDRQVSDVCVTLDYYLRLFVQEKEKHKESDYMVIIEDKRCAVYQVWQFLPSFGFSAQMEPL